MVFPVSDDAEFLGIQVRIDQQNSHELQGPIGAEVPVGGILVVRDRNIVGIA
ncbi:hypothetical protein D3C72_2467320 [compost metagenome]